MRTRHFASIPEAPQDTYRVFMSSPPKHRAEGRGASFSLEIPLGVRFMTLSRVFEDEELDRVQEAVPAG